MRIGGVSALPPGQEPAAVGQVNSLGAVSFALGSIRFQPAGISNFSSGTAAALIEVVSTLICAAWTMAGGSAFSAGLPAAGAAVSAFFLNRPPASLLPKALAAELSTDPARGFRAAFAAAAPAVEPAAALAAAWPASPTALPPPPAVGFFAELQCSPPKAMRSTVFSG